MPRILLDTNVWRALIDAGGIERVRLAAKHARSPVLVAPGVVYEMLRTPDKDLRKRQVQAVTLQSWTRLMTEVFSESADVRAAICAHRPEWLLPEPDLAAYHRLRADWSGGAGFWRRARHDTDREAGYVADLGDDRLEKARREARERRAQMAHLQYDSVSLKGWITRPPKPEPGWDGTDVEVWRVMSAATWWNQLIVEPSIPHLDWLAPFLDLVRIARERGSWNQLWLHEIENSEVPREWLRWAIGWLQGLRKVTPGTPGDNQIAVYTYEADIFVTKDRGFADVINKARPEAPGPVALAHHLRSNVDAVETLIALLAANPT